MSLYEIAGGEEGIRKIVTSFYDAVFDDIMIGFFFRTSNKKRLIDKEVELALVALGAPGVTYTGRDLEEAHSTHPILGGHFERRAKLLEEAMDAHQLDPAAKEAWLSHMRSLRPLITKDVGTECDHDAT